MTAAENSPDQETVDALAARVAQMLNTGDLARAVAGQLATDAVAERVASLVTGQLGAVEGDCWWETSQVMTYTGHGRTLVATDQADGRLHSHQRGKQGRRYTKRSVVDAWMQGATPEQQAQVCGCVQLTRWNGGA